MVTRCQDVRSAHMPTLGSCWAGAARTTQGTAWRAHAAQTLPCRMAQRRGSRGCSVRPHRAPPGERVAAPPLARVGARSRGVVHGFRRRRALVVGARVGPAARCQLLQLLVHLAARAAGRVRQRRCSSVLEGGRAAGGAGGGAHCWGRGWSGCACATRSFDEAPPQRLRGMTLRDGGTPRCPGPGAPRAAGPAARRCVGWCAARRARQSTRAVPPAAPRARRARPAPPPHRSSGCAGAWRRGRRLCQRLRRAAGRRRSPLLRGCSWLRLRAQQAAQRAQRLRPDAPCRRPCRTPPLEAPPCSFPTARRLAHHAPDIVGRGQDQIITVNALRPSTILEVVMSYRYDQDMGIPLS